MFYLGCAPLDDASDVTVLNGNHGRYSYLSTDGLYLDETFRDVRMGGSLDDQWVGGEPFGEGTPPGPVRESERIASALVLETPAP